MNLVPLNEKDTNSTIDLFCECFVEDHYYAQMFPDCATRISEMREEFLPTISYCLSHGVCYGVKESESLIAFILCFDYNLIRDEDYEAFRMVFGCSDPAAPLPNSKTFHEIVAKLQGKTMYCLSIAVHPRFQHKGLASGLVDVVLEKYRKYNLVSDVSNEPSLDIYRIRNFEITTIDSGYYLVVHKKETELNSFAVSGSVRIAVPDTGIFDEHKIPYEIKKDYYFIVGCSISSCFEMTYFQKTEDAICRGELIQLSYESYLLYQRVINIAQYEEVIRGDIALFCLAVPYICKPLLNDNLKQMLLTRRAEWAVVPDIYVSIPLRYSNLSAFSDRNDCAGEKANHFLKFLDFRTHYEAGVPLAGEEVDDLASFKRRIRRFYLGKLWVQITSEVTESNYEGVGDPIGAPALIDLYISLDTESNCAVLTLFSLSSPFLISHFLDNICRNQLMIIDKGTYINLYDYLKRKYDVVKRGTAKAFVMIPKDRDCLQPDQIASLLAGETIYPEGENFGKIVDEEIVSAANSEHGMGQYDRAYFCAYTNVALQFTSDLQCSIHDRLAEESITIFYIELILLEEAAIHIADREIVRLFTSESISDPVHFLSEVDSIYDEYSKTIDFWDVQVNYPTSQLSINMLRKSFRIREQLEYMQRNQAQLQTVFDTKCDIIDRKDSKRMDTSLAIISVLAVFSAWIDGYDYIATWNDVFSQGVIHSLQRVLFVLVLLTAGYAITHLFGNKMSLFIRSRHTKARKKARRKKKT